MKAILVGVLVGVAKIVGCAGAVESPSPSAEPGPPAAGTTEPNALTGADAPCDVRAVLRTYCVDCHQVVMYYPQAPILAFTRSELTTKDESELTLGARMLLRLNDTKDPMPPARSGVASPSEAERKVISDWLSADMPGDACAE